MPIPGQYPEFQEDSRIDGILEFRIENHVLGQKLSGKSTLYIEIGKKSAISRWYPEFQKISGSFQEWWNFKILCWKSNFLT